MSWKNLALLDDVTYTGSAFRCFNDAATDLGTASFRWERVYASNGTIQTSDRNLKKNILYSMYGLKEVLKMNPVFYNWKTEKDKDHKHLGFIAQEINQIIPEIVDIQKKEDGTEIYGLKYAELVPVLVKAIQEQQTQIENLKSELQAMKNKNESAEKHAFKESKK